MNQTFSHPPESFEAFRSRFKPEIRPKDTLPRLRRAMSVDDSFLAEFDALRVYLRPMLENWPDVFLAFLKKHPEPREAIAPEAEPRLREALKAHVKKLALGRFDESYLNTLEDVALRFIHLGVRSVYIAAAYQQITRDAIDLVFERAEKRQAIRVRQLMQILVSALALELNQIQRVYTVYEQRRHEGLLDDIRRGGVCDGALEALLPPPELSLPPEDVELVRSNAQTLLRQRDLVGRAFLKKLFESAPQLRGLFPEDDDRNVAAFSTALETLLERLGRSATALRRAAGVRRAHAGAAGAGRPFRSAPHHGGGDVDRAVRSGLRAGVV